MNEQIIAGDRVDVVWRQKPGYRNFEAVSVNLTRKRLGERVLRFLVMRGLHRLQRTWKKEFALKSLKPGRRAACAVSTPVSRVED